MEIIELVSRAVNEAWGDTLETVFGKCRKRELVDKRIAVYACAAQIFGKKQCIEELSVFRDRCTILHALKNHESWYPYYPEYRRLFNQLAESLNGRE